MWIVSKKNKLYVNLFKKIVWIFLFIDAPIQPKKKKFEETHKLKQIITKTVNKAMEDELREKALEGKRSLTRKEAVTLKKK